MVRPSAPLSLQLPEPDTSSTGRRGKSLGSSMSADLVANGIDLSLLERVSPIEWDNVVLYGQ